MEKGRIGSRPVIEAKHAAKVPEAVYRMCHQCGKQMAGRKQNYPYTQCGLSNVVLIDVLVFNCACGEIAVEIPAIATLHRFIAFELLKKPNLLSGEEVRFLRKFVGYSAVEFAEKIGKTPVSISRWEGGRMTRNADRVLRLAFFAAIIEQDAKTALGPDCNMRVDALVAFASRVRSFNLMAFLETIRDEVKRQMIKVDPLALAEFGRSEATLRGVSTTHVQ
jgi:transcriptional regulator with XRE-family HTH domain